VGGFAPLLFMNDKIIAYYKQYALPLSTHINDLVKSAFSKWGYKGTITDGLKSAGKSTKKIDRYYLFGKKRASAKKKK